MAWTAPFTAAALQRFTAALWNLHGRDNLNLLKTYIDDDGTHRLLVKGFAFSAGQGNGVGGADTQLTSYDVTIPANFLTQPGDMLEVEGTFAQSGVSEAKTVKCAIGSSTKVTLFSATSATPTIIHVRYLLKRRISTDCSIRGVTWYAAAAGDPTGYFVNSSISAINWTTSQTLNVWASGATAASIFLTDYSVWSLRGLNGVTV